MMALSFSSTVYRRLALIFCCLVFINLSNNVNCSCDRHSTGPSSGNSSSSCLGDWFKCENRNRCIPKEWVCNDNFECNDGSDEKNCTCNGFQCPNNDRCILSSWLCDGESDCINGADEENCGPTTTRPCDSRSEFTCANGQCIYSKFVCDGDFDCGVGDLSDEENCPKTTSTTTKRPVCNGHVCEISGECVSKRYVCDGDFDCEDKTDEKNCTVIPCDQFSCPITGRCIPLSKVCDGENECGKREDESDCHGKCTAFTCKNSGTCIPLRFKCDGEYDCSDKSDEPEVCPCVEDEILCYPTGLEIGADSANSNSSNCYPVEILCKEEGLSSSLTCETELDCSKFTASVEDTNSTSTTTVSPFKETQQKNYLKKKDFHKINALPQNKMKMKW